jgi:hypothetical protein
LHSERHTLGSTRIEPLRQFKLDDVAGIRYRAQQAGTALIG